MTKGVQLAQFACRIPVSVRRNPNAPIILICGWWFCTEEHLSRYSQLLMKELGCGVLQSAIDPELLMLTKINKRERRRHHAMRTLAILNEAVNRADVVDRPLYIMLFSSGGAYTWAEMIDLIAPGGEFALIGERLAGVIFDSAPCHFSIAHAVNASTGALQNITLTTFQKFALKVAVIFSVILHYFVNLSLFHSLQNTDGEAFWRRMQSAPPRRELYLFSTADSITDSEKLTELISHRVDMGADVQCVDFKTSEHVKHLSSHTAKYVSVLRSWMYSTTSS